jgi:excisionase family DNA binding protein
MPNDLAPHLLTRPQVADALGASVSHVDRLIGGGSLPALKIGRLVRIRPADVEAFLESCAIPRAACPPRRVEPVPERCVAYSRALSESLVPSFRRLLRSQQQSGAST